MSRISASGAAVTLTDEAYTGDKLTRCDVLGHLPWVRRQNGTIYCPRCGKDKKPVLVQVSPRVCERDGHDVYEGRWIAFCFRCRTKFYEHPWEAREVSRDTEFGRKYRNDLRERRKEFKIYQSYVFGTSTKTQQRIQRLAKRDGYRCWYCKRIFDPTKPDRRCTIDHVIPRAKKGTSRLSNLRLACARCNHDKGDKEYFEGQQ